MFRRFAFPLAVMFVVIAAALLAWLLSSGTVLRSKCERGGGAWNAGQRVCTLASPPPQSA